MKQATILLLAALVLFSCRTKDKIQAGKGGSAIINLYPEHHGIAKNLVNFKVYVKYGTNDAPASGIAYDDSVACSNHDMLISGTFAGLQNGDYYFYATGYDTSVKQDLHGGAPYTITEQNSQNVVLSVSE